ncbi:MAG: glycosyltransferase family 2 protein, partial [Caloramator sp.]|nr:glycosyltransferase family 2 protein [Caloramator sp.]
MYNLLLNLIEDIGKNISFEENLLQIKKLIQLGKINEDDIINSVLISQVEDKNRVLNDIAVYLYNNELYDYVIPLLNKSYELNNQHRDTIYNLSYVLCLLGELDLALTYLNNLKDKDKDILDLIKEIEKSNLKSMYPNTSIIILTYNNLDYTKLCIESIRKFTSKNTYEIIVVDNNSTDGTAEWLKNQQDLKIILNSENMGFPKGCNQGIKIAQKNNDILLLNNDVIVTPNWLDNLRKCLYSNEVIGAVGAVTNSCSNYQMISVNYKNLNEMIEFAQNYNISDKDKWEERLRLVGYCMLVKREVIDKIGLLDEIFTPGNFEDDDYSFRIRKAGYRLYLCKDTFVHHFGSASFRKNSDKYEKLLIDNRNKFINKWGFDPYYIAEIKREIVDIIIEDNNQNNINVLHVGCAGGGTLLYIK